MNAVGDPLTLSNILCQTYITHPVQLLLFPARRLALQLYHAIVLLILTVFPRLERLGICLLTIPAIRPFQVVRPRMVASGVWADRPKI